MASPHQYSGPSAAKYRAPKFKHVADVRRERFVNNFMSTKAMQDEATALKAAPFALDQQYRQNLLQDTDQTLNGFGTRGDYENMTVDIYNAASTFTRKKAPLAQNLSIWSAYQANLNKLYGDDDLDIEDMQGTLALSREGYEGLSFDENGNAKYFSGITAVKNPGIDEMLADRLKELERESYASERNSLGVGEDEAFTQKVSQKTTGFSQERVAIAIAGVMNDPRVKAYNERKAEIRALNMKGTENEFLQGTSEDVTATLTSLDEAISKETNGEKKDQLIAQRAELETMKGDIANAMENPTMAQELIKNMKYQEIVNNKRHELMSSKAIYKTEKDSVIIGYDKLWLQNEKLRKEQEVEFGMQTTAVTITGEEMAFADAFGKDYASAQTYMKGVDSSIASLEEKLKDNTLEESTKKMYEGEYNQLAAKRFMALQRFQQEFEGMSPEMLDNPEYLKLKKAANSLTEAKKKLQSSDDYQYYGTGTSMDRWETSQNTDPIKELQSFMEGHGMELSTGGKVMYAPTVVSNYMPGLDPKKQNAFSNQLEGLFSGGFAGSDHLKVYAPATDQDVQTISSDNMMSIDLAREQENIPQDADYSGFGIIAVNPTGGGPLLQINWTSKDKGTSGKMYMPLNQGGIISLGPGVQQYITSDYISFMTSIDAGKMNPGKTASIPYHMVDESGTNRGTGTMEVRYEEDGTEMITLVAPDGSKSTTYDTTSNGFNDMVQNGVMDNGELIKLVPDSNGSF